MRMRFVSGGEDLEFEETLAGIHSRKRTSLVKCGERGARKRDDFMEFRNCHQIRWN